MPADLPLGDLAVTEVGCGLAGAFCGRLLAGFGATVWKMEPPGGDPSRHAKTTAGPAPGSNSSLFEFLNGGKMSVAAALDTRDGLERLSALARASDFVIYSEFDSRIDHTIVSTLRESLVPGSALVVVEPFGRDGPYADYRAVPITYQAMGGYMYIMGDPDREPLAFPGQQPYYAAGLAAYAAGLALLRNTEEARPGGFATLSIHEVIPTLSLHTVSLYTYEGKVRKRNGNRWATLHPVTTYECADGWILLALPWEHWWERFCILIGRPELADDPRFAGGGNRLDHAHEVDNVVSAWLKDKTRDEVVATLSEWGLPKGPLLELDEVLSDPHLHERGYFQETADDGKRTLLPGLPFGVRELPWKIGAVPGPGAHTDKALREASDRAAARKDQPPRAQPDVPRSGTNAGGPLTGVRVVDLTWVWAGPLATRLFGDLGAEVIKVEFPSIAARPTAPWNIGSFHELNRNKKSITLDLATAEGAAAFESMVKASDVIFENFRPRVMSNWGFDFKKLASLNPEIVLVSMPGYGSSGPYRDEPSVGPTLEALAGVGALLGYDDTEPFTSAFAYPDPVSALWAVCGALSGLHRLKRSGRGCHVDLSQHEATITMFGEYLIEFQRTGVKPRRLGNRHPEWAPHGCYPCAGVDRWITIAIRNDDEWLRFRRAMGDPAWARDARFGDPDGRWRHQDEIDRRIREWTAEWDTHELTRHLQEAEIAAGFVADGPALLADPHLQYRRYFVRMNQPGVGERPYSGLPFSIEGVNADNWRPSPELGQDTRQVLLDVAGMTAAEADDLATKLQSGLDRPTRFVG